MSRRCVPLTRAIRHLFPGWLLLLSFLGGVGSAEPAQVRIAGDSYTPLYQVGDGVNKVKVKGFLLDRYPVTNQDFLSFVKQNPRWQRSRVKRIFADEGYLRHWKGDLDIGQDAGDRAVVNVSWFAAKAYAEWKGQRLPTQDEWEFVARADENSKDATQDPKFHRRILNWYGRPTPNPVPKIGSTYKNVYGVYDLHGLVWEWVGDFNTVLVTGESRQDTGIDRGLYCAGGSVGSTDPSDYAAYMRYAFRSSLNARYTVGNLGFRCAADL
jgi:formylglycine-generating enzyme required for sulfatase activity